MRRAVIAFVGVAVVAGLVGLQRWRAKSEPAVRPPEVDDHGFAVEEVTLPMNDGLVLVPTTALPPPVAARGPQVPARFAGSVDMRASVTFESEVLRVLVQGRDGRRTVVFDLKRRELVRDVTEAVQGELQAPASLPRTTDRGFIVQDEAKGQSAAEAIEVPLVRPHLISGGFGWSADKSMFALVTEAGVLVWRRGGSERVATLERVFGLPIGVGRVRCSPNGRSLVTESRRVLDLVAGTAVSLDAPGSDSVPVETETSWRRDGAEVDVVVRGAVHRFDPTSGHLLAPPRTPSNGKDSFKVFLVDGELEFAGLSLSAKAYEISRVETGERLLPDLPEISMRIGVDSWPASIAASSDGDTIAKWSLGHLAVRHQSARRGWTYLTAPAFSNETLGFAGPLLLLSARGSKHASGTRSAMLELWDVGRRARIVNLGLPDDEGPVSAQALSHAADRVVLPSGRVVSLTTKTVVSEGPSGLARAGARYDAGCWGVEDRWITLVGDGAIVLHRTTPTVSAPSTLRLGLFTMGDALAVLVMTPDGHFDGPKALLDSLWLRTDDGLRRASSLTELHQPGLLAAFHRGD